MYLSVILLICPLSWSLPIDTIIEIQHWGVVGGDQVLLNGVSLTSRSQEVNSIIRSISAAVPLPTPTDANQTATSKTHTVLRLRECILEGSQVHWTDRVLYDGKVYLSLDQTDTWTAQAPQALALKAVWDQDVERTREERVRLQEGCVKLIKELRLSAAQSGIPMSTFLVPVFAFLALIALVVISLISNKQGLRHPGGVIGSVIHYPQDITEMPPDRKGFGYQTL